MARKITAEMNGKDVIIMMCEGNPGALMVLMDMIKNPDGLLDIYMLDEMDIRGSYLYILNSDCCQRNPMKFKRTIKMLHSGVFTKEEIFENLERDYAIPFIDDDIEMNIPSYGEDFGPGHPKWNEWVRAQKESFKKRS